MHTQGNVRLAIKIPHDPENAQWKLEGQTLSVEIDIKSTIRDLKEKLMVRAGAAGGELISTSNVVGCLSLSLFASCRASCRACL